ncbi:telomere length regulation protein TEL2 [Achlya hypogyna]|uniref:Telomere length regulation protein TEL2 n=1 Tax=Achlya hypogyna TaxID=1202772 RepID=A0A1V9YAY2_ACHHY|nr:telomere length regulation protein TEL2 [Achlya hypogyna]
MAGTLEGWKDALAAAEASYDMDAVVALLAAENDLLLDNHKFIVEHVLIAVVPAWVTAPLDDVAALGALSIVPAVDALLSLATAKRGAHVRSLFLALVNVASQRQGPVRSHEMAVRQLTLFARGDGYACLFAEMLSTAKLVRLLQWLSDSCSTIVFNLQLPHTPRDFLPQHFYSEVAAAFLSHRGHSNVGVLGALLVPKLVRLGHASAFVPVWLRTEAAPDAHYPWLEVAASCPDVSTDGDGLPSSAYEGLFAHACRCPPPGVAIDWARLLPPAVRAHPIFQHVVTHKLVWQAKSPLPPAAMNALLAVLEGPEVADESPLETVVDQLVQRWSVGVTTDSDVDAGAARLLAAALARLAAREAAPKSLLERRRWIGPICKGINERMNAAIEGTRQSGMRVAVALSKILTPDSPLMFDDDDLPAEAVESADTDEGGAVREDSGMRPSVEVAAQSAIADPDELFDSDDEENGVPLDEDDAASEMSLEPYELSDDEVDETDGAAPMVYFLDVLEGLQQDDDRDRAELALRSLPALVRRRPYDLADMAVQLCKAVTRLDDAFQTPHFDALRKASLLGLALEAPAQSLPLLASQVFDHEKLFQVRLDILSVLGDAAPQVTNKATLSLYFYPLLLPLQAQLRADSLRPLEHVLMAHIFQTLAAVLEASGVHGTQTIPMATAYLELIWSQRMHEIPSVRRQVLFGLSRVLLVLPPFAWREAVERLDMQTTLAAYLSQLQQWDPDHGCRAAAKLLSTTVGTGALPP